VSQVTVIDHPLVQYNLAKLRDKKTGQEEFRRRMGEVSALMIYEATRDFQTRAIRVATPLTMASGQELKRPVALVSILRAGFGMLPSILQLLPHATAGFVGVKRNERTLQPTVYHHSLPDDLRAFETVLIDPMLATGGSALAALDLLRERSARRVRLVHLIAAPEGIARVHSAFPDVPIFTAAIDRRLDKRGFILPGLGDAGDRLFGV